MNGLLLFLFFFSCSDTYESPASQKSVFANVTNVQVRGPEDSYTFSVTISSPDEGCEQYADWWEVVNENGELVYRRILAHSHVNEQPFTRSGRGVKISENQIVYIRAHMNNVGYGGELLKGSVLSGFEKVELKADFGLQLEKEKPLPQGCTF